MKQRVDYSGGGTFMTKNEEEVWCLFETWSDNSRHNASAYSRSPTVLNKGNLEEEQPSDESTHIKELENSLQ